MKKITQENLAQFAPTYEGSYDERIQHFAQRIGVESKPVERDYGWGIFNWNENSAIGLSWEEVSLINLVYSVAKNNNRYDNDAFIDSKHGGNTAEHPVFIGVALDACRDSAGFGPKDFDATSPQHLQAAQLIQRTHAIAAVHDFGELVDVSYGEMHETGASRKEPDEEELVVPFQMKMAAYALSVGQPELYVDTITDLKTQALAAKQKYYQEAVDGKITGDEFIDKFGKALGALIEGAEHKIREDLISPAYLKAIETLQELNEAAEHASTIPGVLFSMLDRTEGNLHYARYAGRAAREYGENTPETDPQQRMLNRLLDSGRSMSYNLADSKSVIDQMNFAQKNIIAAFEVLKNEPEETRGVSEKLVRETAAALMRARIPLLQKAPPFVDFTETGKKEDKAELIEADQDVFSAYQVATRVDTQRVLAWKAIPALKARGGVVDAVEGVMDTKALIAICEKAAQAIESGAYTPEKNATGLVIPLDGKLPEEFHVTRADMKATSKQYPMEVASDYQHDRWTNLDEPVRVRGREISAAR